MKLTKLRITNFQSIQDSTEFDIGDVTCLVGKNEAGKTALLKALYRLNPINESDGDFISTDDYPRQTVAEYQSSVKTGNEQPANVIKATFSINPNDIGDNRVLTGLEFPKDEPLIISICKGYSNKLIFDLSNIKLTKSIRESNINDNLEDVEEKITDNDVEKNLLSILPKFLYFDEFYQMEGQENVNQLLKRFTENKLKDSDYPLLGLIQLAGLDLQQIKETEHTETLINKLEGAGNALTSKVLPYWSQNQHLRMKFDLRTGKRGDPRGMTTGLNIWSRIEDTKHFVTTSLGTRSRGFVWFFSFLAWYNDLLKKHDNLILLLDEPGLFLHAKAQGDLLHFFEKELIPHHQLIYTTHSPFMVDPMHFDRIRIVQDRSIEPNSDRLSINEQGTKVITEVLEAIPDSLFPLQGALGYEITQTLFIGPNSLIVEGVSDLLYIQTISALLQRKEKTGLSPNWTITPVGGSGNVSKFVSLIRAQTNLNIAVLIDFQKKDQQEIQKLYKTKLLKQNKVLTYADFVKGNEADIEDMFDPDFYLQLVNQEFGISLKIEDLPTYSPRIISCLEEHFKNNPLPNNVKFNHYRPALYFSKNVQSLESALTDSHLDHFQKAFDALNKLLVN